MTLLIALLLAATPPLQKPPAEGRELLLDCSAYLARALGEAEAQRRVDEPLQRAFEGWYAALVATAEDSDYAEMAGVEVSERVMDLDRVKRTPRAARTAWCRANAPQEKSA